MIEQRHIDTIVIEIGNIIQTLTDQSHEWETGSVSNEIAMRVIRGELWSISEKYENGSRDTVVEEIETEAKYYINDLLLDE